MNVIFLGSFLYPHGYAATKRKQQFLDYIISRGDKARVLITLRWARGNELNNIEGVHKQIPYETLGTNVKPNILLPFTFLLYLLKANWRLTKIKLKGYKNILVVFGINFDTLIPILFAKLIGYKIVFDIVEDFSSLKNIRSIKSKIKYFFLVPIQNVIKYRIANGISVITRFLENSHLTRLKRKIPLVIVPISAENLKFQQTSKVKNKHFTFLYSGTYGEKEGLDVLFNAFSLIRKKYPNTKLILTGDCPEKIKIKYIEKLDLRDYVILTGRLEDEDYYEQLSNASTMLMTRNKSEFANAGFPYKLGEYLATGNPVIATKVSDIELYLKHNDNAILIEPEDSDALYAAMIYTYEQKENAAKIGLNGRKVCEKYFNPEINSKRFYQLLVDC